MNNKVVFLGVLLLVGGCSFKNPYYDKLHGTWTCNGRGQTFAGDTYHPNGRFTRYLIENDISTFQTGIFSLDRSLLILTIDKQSVGPRSKPLKKLPKQIIYKYAISQLTSSVLDFKMKSKSVGQVINKKTQVCRKVKEQRIGLLYSSAKIGAAFKVSEYVGESPLTVAIKFFKEKSTPGTPVLSASDEKYVNEELPDANKSVKKPDTQNLKKPVKVANKNQPDKRDAGVNLTEGKDQENKITENKELKIKKSPQKLVQKVEPVVLKSKDKKVTIIIRKGTAGIKAITGTSNNASNSSTVSKNSIAQQSESKRLNVEKSKPSALGSKEHAQIALLKPKPVTPKLATKNTTVAQSQNADKSTAESNAIPQIKAAVPKTESDDNAVSNKTIKNSNNDNYPVISDRSSTNKNGDSALSILPEPEPDSYRNSVQHTKSASARSTSSESAVAKSEKTERASVTHDKEKISEARITKSDELSDEIQIKKLVKLQQELTKEIVFMDAFQRDRNRAYDTMRALSLALVSGLNIQTLKQEGNLFTISGHSDTNLSVIRYIRKLSDSPHLFSVKLKSLGGKRRHRRFVITFQQAHSIKSYNYLTVSRVLDKQNLAEAKRKVFELKNIRNRLLYRYPNKNETPLLIRKLTNKAKLVGLKVITFDKQKLIKKKGYNIIPVRIEAVGHYDSLIVYLNRLGRRKHINRVRNLYIQKQSESNKEHDLFISMTLYLIRLPAEVENKREPVLDVKLRFVKLAPYNRVSLAHEGGIRNPFSYVAARVEPNCNGPLNGYRIDHIKLVAVFNNSKHLALLKTPDGKIYRARSGSCIARNTRIGKITRKSIILKSVSRQSGKPIVEVFNLDLQRSK